MHRRVLYLTPYPPLRSGIADYAACFKRAVEENSDWRLDPMSHRMRLSGNSLGDLMSLYRRVATWAGSGALRETALVHAEIGYKQHEEFYTLFWLHRLVPSLPVCITVHDPPLVVTPALYPLCLGLRWPALRRTMRVLDYTPIGRAVVRSVLSNSRHIFVLSNAGLEALRSLLPDHPGLSFLPHVTYDSLETRRTVPMRQLDRERPEEVRVLFLGFWGPGKGIEILLEAMKRLWTSTEQKVCLLLSGAADDSHTGRRYAAGILNSVRQLSEGGTIEVLGYVAPERLDATFARSDIFVVPYLTREGLSSSAVLFRAMASGLPVVASRTGTVPEEIRHMDNGILVEPGDVADLHRALRLLVGEANLRARLGQRAQQHLLSEHSHRNIARIISEAYEGVVSNLQ